MRHASISTSFASDYLIISPRRALRVDCLGALYLMRCSALLPQPPHWHYLPSAPSAYEGVLRCREFSRELRIFSYRAGHASAHRQRLTIRAAITSQCISRYLISTRPRAI